MIAEADMILMMMKDIEDNHQYTCTKVKYKKQNHSIIRRYVCIVIEQ